MAFVKEEIEFDVLEAKIMVLERESGEYPEPWSIISFSVDDLENCTPKELRQLGKWLIEQGKRIGKEYKSNGARKA